MLSIFFAQAQFKITGLVIDNDLNTPIKKAKIFDIDSKNETFIDASGKLSILTFGDLEISDKGYKIKYIEVNKDEDFVITLTPSIYELEEVIINGLTIPIKQKYATNAISLVSAVDLNRGNLMELHPILNRVSGFLWSQEL
ncbi:peptidase associated/transthyretin-like domain-containing protein [Confluentibacter flavum]|uniref:TonB-dependent receptor n=1 Tax=Confluentibacter flavum TaxID=1909700 RepID=A0A2N3HK78_9FLAO|nr:hypothetical protein [Confluentibacter flavum]PKQ45380.1 hypothetical protein CSW08_08420 [Confluentibacter flavum]